MDKVTVNPTREQLAELFAEATAAANARGKTRLVDEDHAYRVNKVFEATAGAAEGAGGGVANAYGYAAETSALEYAWYTDAAGDKHIRVVAARIRVSGRHVSSILPGTRVQQDKWCAADAEFLMVYSDLARFYTHPAADVPAGFQKKLKKNPNDQTTWLILADWLEDRNAPANHLIRTPADADVAALIRRLFQPVVAAVCGRAEVGARPHLTGG